MKDIQGFVYGGFTSRFWVFRKHINSMPQHKLYNLPFYSWECLTLYTKEREINLVIKDQFDLQKLIEFLIVSLKTVDGRKGSALKMFKIIQE